MSRILLIRNHMIFLVIFGINKHLRIFFQILQITLALRARATFLVFEKIYSCLFIPNCTRNHVITYTNFFHAFFFSGARSENHSLRVPLPRSHARSSEKDEKI